VPTKHIDDASFTLAEETLVKAVVLTKMAVKESEVLSLLIHKGAEAITPVDILTRLVASPAAWAEIFSQVLNECGEHYPKEYIRTIWEFREKADRHSGTWRQYRTDAIHQHISDAGKRLQKLHDFTLSRLEPAYELETEEDKLHHEQWLNETLRKMDDALGSVSGSALGSLTDEERQMLNLMMESEDFQVLFEPMPEKRRSDGSHEFCIRAARFPNPAQGGLMALLADLKGTGLKLTWHSSDLHKWLQEHPGLEVSDLVIQLFAFSDEGSFTLTGEAEQTEQDVMKCLKAHGIEPISSGAVMATLNRAAAAARP